MHIYLYALNFFISYSMWPAFYLFKISIYKHDKKIYQHVSIFVTEFPESKKKHFFRILKETNISAIKMCLKAIDFHERLYG
jgi:hypothetical protein